MPFPNSCSACRDVKDSASLLMPGFAFDISDPAHVRPMLKNIRKIVEIVTDGRPW